MEVSAALPALPAETRENVESALASLAVLQGSLKDRFDWLTCFSIRHLVNCPCLQHFPFLPSLIRRYFDHSLHPLFHLSHCL